MTVEFQRLPTSPDDPWILPVARLVWQEIYGQSGEPEEKMVSSIATPEPTTAYYRLTEGDELVGMAALDKKGTLEGAPADEFELTLIAVSLTRQGAGYGRYILKLAERQAALEGASALRLYPNGDANGFYARQRYTAHPGGGNYLVRTLPPEMPPVALPQPKVLPQDVSVAALDAWLAHGAGLAERALRNLYRADTHRVSAEVAIEDILDPGIDRSIWVAVGALGAAGERYKRATQALQEALSALEAYRADITGGDSGD